MSGSIIKSVSGSAEEIGLIDRLSTELGLSFSQVVIKAVLSLEDELNNIRINYKKHEEAKPIEKLKPITSHIPIRKEVLAELAKQDNPEIPVVSTEKTEFCLGQYHEMLPHIEYEGVPVAKPCKNCNYEMIINGEKYEEWKLSQSKPMEITA